MIVGIIYSVKLVAEGIPFVCSLFDELIGVIVVWKSNMVKWTATLLRHEQITYVIGYVSAFN